MSSIERPVHIGTPTRIPTDRYTTAERARQEARSLWEHTWQMACREEEVAEVGDYVEYVIADQSYLVVRSTPETIQAFSNACRHRGNLLKLDRGHTSELRCTFHAWCWELDGSCREIHEPEDFGCPSMEDLRLPECLVGRWGGFVFLNPDPAGTPFEDWIAPVAERCTPYRMEDMRYLTILSTTVPANWKLGVEAFNESYHIFGTHPQAIVSNDGSYARLETMDEHGLMIVPMGIPSPHLEIEEESDIIDQMVDTALSLAKFSKPQVEQLKRIGAGEETIADGALREILIGMRKERAIEHGYASPGFSDDQYWDQHEWHVFPNLILGLVPGEMFGFRFRPDGLDPDSMIFEVLSMRIPEAPDKPFAGPVHVPYSRDPEERRATWGPILHQDFSNLEKVQRGLHQSSLSEVRISGYQEQLISHYHEVIESYLERFPPS
jgi:phenylpropionate dioxygenase-like ring-hydroxylating dioxygenase large terminal subunit